MAEPTKTISFARGTAPALMTELREVVRIFKSLFDPYRPELHYMRGPGPKWHAKHARASAARRPLEVATLARAKA